MENMHWSRKQKHLSDVMLWNATNWTFFKWFQFLLRFLLKLSDSGEMCNIVSILFTYTNTYMLYMLYICKLQSNAIQLDTTSYFSDSILYLGVIHTAETSWSLTNINLDHHTIKKKIEIWLTHRKGKQNNFSCRMKHAVFKIYFLLSTVKRCFCDDQNYSL